MHGRGHLLEAADADCAVCELECDGGVGSGDGVGDAGFWAVVGVEFAGGCWGGEGEGELGG